MRTAAHLFPVLLVGCATSATTPASLPTSPASVPAPSLAQSEARGVAEGPPEESVAALQDRLTLLGREDQGDGACLFRQVQAERPRFVGAFAPAVHPLPLPPQDLALALGEAGPVDILTRYGRYGNAPGHPTFAAWTEGPPPTKPVLLALTSHGPVVRGIAEGLLPAVLSEQDPTALAETLRTSGLDGVFVAADADLPEETLVQWLGALDAKGLPSTLVTMLPIGLSAPVKPAADSAALRCPAGLPEERGELGELPAEALRAGIAPMRSELVACLGAGSIASAQGGRMQLALRIDGQGRVVRRCVVATSMADEGLLSCVLARVAALRFEPPRPSGIVDMELPLVLRPVYASAPRGLCTE